MAVVPHHENWSEHQSTMFSSLHEKQKQGKFCDVILKCSDSNQSFNAHGCVLSAASTVLDGLLNDAMENECMVPGTSKLLVALPDEVISSCMDSLLNFIYSGNIDLNFKSPGIDTGPSTRKSKRQSSKAKAIGENVDSEASPDIQLLYAFLKASRRLQIQTLTEHLESAVTLSEMKMSESRDTAIDTPSAKKAKHVTKVGNSATRHEQSAGREKLGGSEKKRQSNSSDSGMRRKSTRQTSVEDVVCDEGNSVASTSRNTKSKKNVTQSEDVTDEVQCGNMEGQYGIWSASNSENEQSNGSAKCTNKARVVKRLQCPTCQKVFKDVSVYEVHMKNHISEIEKVLSRNKQLAEDDESETEITVTSVISQKDTGVSPHRGDTPKTSQRPMRASTAKFHEMMKSKFGVEQKVTKAPGQNQDNASFNANEACSIVVNNDRNHEAGVETMTELEVVRPFVLSEDSLDEELEVVETEPEWRPMEQEIVFTAVNENDSHGLGQNFVDEASGTFEKSPAEAERDKDFNSKMKTRKKRKSKSGEDDSQICSDCGKEVTDMRTHMKTHSKVITCHVCGENFKYRNALNRHMQFHNGGLPCSNCDEKIFSQREMTKHMAKHNQKKMRTKCPDCDKSFTSEYVMQLHRRTHTGEERFVCTMCNKRFPYKSSLKMHMLLHTGEKPYICSICGKCFVQKIHAREHEMQHQGIKRQFQCHICLKIFAHKCGLTRHVADIHNKSRPFVCDKCGKSFPRKTKLIEHTRMHTGEKPYVCDICGMRYKANRSLKCHKKKEHGVFVPDYAVGIWRKGPLPPSPEDAKTGKGKKIQSSKNSNANKSLLSFPFPISSSDMNLAKSDEEIIANITEHVSLVTGEGQVSEAALINNEKTSRHFSYPVPQPEQTYHAQFTTVSDVSTFATTTLPPASTLTKSDPTASLGYPMFSTQKTFIVPLTSSAQPSVPVVVDPNPSPIDQSQVPGLMVSYMMPAQSYTISGNAVTVDTLTDHTPGPIPDVSRSASVPPMSTFSRVTAANGNQGAESPVQTLPGMHTFQPAVQFRVTQNAINGDIIEVETSTEIPLIREGHQILTVRRMYRPLRMRLRCISIQKNGSCSQPRYGEFLLMELHRVKFHSTSGVIGRQHPHRQSID